MTTPSAAPTGLTHACARCGAPVPLDVGLCERCNPIGLRDAASSQVHGTVFLAIALAVIGLAIVGLIAVSGIGPFEAAVAGFRPDGDAVRVTLTVTNEGTKTGSSTCRVSDPTVAGGQAGFIQSPRIAPGETRTFEARVVGIGTTANQLTVECTSP
jgi:hypothetical protein